jgi:hypothetical protein
MMGQEPGFQWTSDSAMARSLRFALDSEAVAGEETVTDTDPLTDHGFWSSCPEARLARIQTDAWD